MYSLLLVVIYVAFISLGLPDSLIGAGWPTMQQSFAVPLSYAGAITVIIACGTVFSSLKSDYLTKKFGTGRVMTCSVATTALAVLGFAFSPSFWVMCLFALPYGLGAGAVDAALNNFVALHYKARHMSWLHCFWGVGASISPYIMGVCLGQDWGWRSGFQIVGLLQAVLAAALTLTLPIWKKFDLPAVDGENRSKALTLMEIIRLPGVPVVLFAFFCYCAIEQTAGIWASSFLVLARNIPEDIAASYGAYFFVGITVGRFLCGFVAEKFGDKQLIRGGIWVIMCGAFFLFSHSVSCLIGLVIVGLGCAPIYPAIIHSTPENFGREHSQAVIGVEMASAYVGIIIAPALFGIIADHISISLFPVYLLILAVGIMLSMEYFNQKK